MTKELQLLQDASKELKTLRQRNNYQSGRLQMFDDMMLLLRTAPGYGTSQGMGEDLVWQIDQHISEQEIKDKSLTKTA